MDVAKRLADFRDQPPEQWLAPITRYLQPGVVAVFVIAIAYQLATLTWTLVPGSVSAVAPVAPQPDGAGSVPSADFSSLLDSHLFGVAADVPAAAPAAVLDAPDTNLSLTLKGILSREGDSNGGAIISTNRGEDEAYTVGQTIEGADGAKLHSVYPDRVLLDRGGRLETLRLPKELTTSTSAFTAAPLPQAAAPSGSLRETISQNAARLTDIIQIAPHVQEGQVVGFRVRPGRDRASFERLGLLANDVVTDINGVVLDDQSQGLQVFASLGEATQANVTVLRDGVPQVIVIDTAQLQNLEENRE
ncbi:MAG TPA: type II secretion system protein GspC [Gammaproteobacteria bacterium]|nr:type II secretion system protein GspC [Gammaproteobacteria bacterium]